VVQFLSFSTSAQHKGCQPHVTAVLFLSKEPPVPANMQGGWVPQSVWTFWRRKKPLDLAGIQSGLPNLWPRHYKDYANLAPNRFLPALWFL